MKKVLFLAFMLFLPSFASDTFVTSCQSKWNANAKALKSIRSEMNQHISIGEFNSTQSASFLYLNTDRLYNRIEMDSQMGKITNICRGDSLFLKVGDSKWQIHKEGCNNNSPFLMNTQIAEKTLKFVKNVGKSKMYKDSEGNQYKIDTKTCRIIEMSSAEYVSTFDYSNVENVDIPVQIKTEIKENGLKYDIEYNKISVNKGVTKSFFNIE